jgi:hypothetical protein
MNKLEKITSRIKKSPPVLVFLLVLFLASSLVTLYSGWQIAYDWYVQSFKYQDKLLDDISKLSTNTNIGYFKDILGEPVFVNNYENFLCYSCEFKDNYKEYIFVNSLFYVQAITDLNNKVLIFSVTTRSDDFNPKLSLGPFSINIKDPFVIELGKTKFYEIENKMNSRPLKIYSFIGANTFGYSESYYFGNPGFYQTYIFGENDASYFNKPLFSSGESLLFPNSEFSLPSTILDDGENFYLLNIESAFASKEVDRETQLFRKNAIINTYSITEPLLQFDEEDMYLLKNFFPGPKKTQIRVLER